MTKPTTPDEILDQIANTSSINEKVEILQKHKDNKILKLIVTKALDPFTMYYMKKIPDHKVNNVTVVNLESIITQLDKLSSRLKTGNEAIRFVQQILSQLEEKDAELIKRVITKDLKSGFGVSIVNTAWGKGTIPTFDVMLCAKYTQKNVDKLSWPCAVQEKMDGMRVIFKVSQNGVDVLSRSGRNLGLSELFKSELFHLIYTNNLNDKKSYVVDGELMVKEKTGSYMSRKKANGILNKASKGTLSDDDKENIYAVVWDIIPFNSFSDGVYDVSYKDRYDYLQRCDTLSKCVDKRIEVLPTVICDSMDTVMPIYNRFIKAGSEGAVVKEMSAGWKNKRVNHHIKMKVENECELIIKEVVQGEGKYLGKLGAFVCESSCGGLKVNVGSGFSDAEREDCFSPDLIDTIVTVKFNEVISAKNAGTKSLFLPIFVKLRADKKKADSLKTIEKK